jgi:hypothetical protein
VAPKPFAVEWQYPRFLRKDGVDPKRLKQVGGRPLSYTSDTLLECLGDQCLISSQWSEDL